jgi:hypothetical protein
MQRGNIYLSVAEEDILKYLKGYLISDCGYEEVGAESEALNQIIGQKRELAFEHGRRGNLPLSRQIKKELSEWTVEDEEFYQEQMRLLKEVKNGKKRNGSY